jgi:hypothetical protein
VLLFDRREILEHLGVVGARFAGGGHGAVLRCAVDLALPIGHVAAQVGGRRHARIMVSDFIGRKVGRRRPAGLLKCVAME